MPAEIHTPEKILIAARKIFIDKGLDGARMQDIANEAGINKAMLHYYFRNKEKLFETIFDQLANEFLPKLFSILELEIPLFEKIEKFCSAYIQQEIETPYVPMFIVKEINRDPDLFLKKVLRGRNHPLVIAMVQIKQEMAQGNIKPVEPVQLLLNIISLCIFPFLVQPMVQIITGIEREQFVKLMEQRKVLVPQLIIQSIKL